jgi:hypothetical protein
LRTVLGGAGGGGGYVLLPVGFNATSTPVSL